MIHVAIGLCVNPEGRILMGRRNGPRLQGAYECPGGKVLHGEDPYQAVQRTWAEHLGVKVSPRGLQWQVIAESVVHLDRVMCAHLIPLVSGELGRSRKHSLLIWILPEQAVRDLPCTPAFYAQYRIVSDYAKKAVRA